MKSRFTRTVRCLLSLGFTPSAWRMPSFALLGIAAGLGLFTLRISESHSYLSDNPRTCLNCHVMVPQYATWQRSSHAKFTVCNDCHVPHDSLAKKYAFKAHDGMRHTTLFTFRREPQVIRASVKAEHVIQENCLRCHERQLAGTKMLTDSNRKCLECHRDVPHGDVGGLSSTPNVNHPHLPPVTESPFQEKKL